MGRSAKRRITYQIIEDYANVLILATYVDGTYVGKSKGYPDPKSRSIINIYPYQLLYRVDVNLRQERSRDELPYERK